MAGTHEDVASKAKALLRSLSQGRHAAESVNLNGAPWGGFY
jgi:hypothetical protein